MLHNPSIVIHNDERRYNPLLNDFFDYKDIFHHIFLLLSILFALNFDIDRRTMQSFNCKPIYTYQVTFRVIRFYGSFDFNIVTKRRHVYIT